MTIHDDVWDPSEETGSALTTDLYQLTMMAGYEASGMSEQRAVFELFVRQLPEHRSYLIFAGLEHALESLRNLSFSVAQVDLLRDWPIFATTPSTWFDALLGFRFEGDVWAIPEGTVVFAGEPLLRVEASLPQAQLVETMLLATLNYPTIVASKASRIVDAAQGRGVIDFGVRRGHGLPSSFVSARAAYLAGFAGTSQVEAARRLAIPAMGTMAHSWVEAFDSEVDAFQTFANLYQHSTLLVDTYDTLEGVKQAALIEPAIGAIRIDSGDLLALSSQARMILDEHDRSGVRIVVSGDLDENSIQGLLAAGAPIDQFGVGTQLVNSVDSPSLSIVYKLVESNGTGRIKISPGKALYPFAKQVYRCYDASGRMQSDSVVRVDERAEGKAMLEPVLKKGHLLKAAPEPDRSPHPMRAATKFSP